MRSQILHSYRLFSEALRLRLLLFIPPEKKILLKHIILFLLERLNLKIQIISHSDNQIFELTLEAL